MNRARQVSTIKEVAVKNVQKAYAEKYDAKLHELNAQIVLLIAEADKTKKTQEKAGYYKIIEALLHRRDTVEAKLQELKNTGDDGAWENLKADAEKAWAEVRRPFTPRSLGLNEPCRSGIEAEDEKLKHINCPSS